MQETAGDVLVRFRALAERVASPLCGARASRVVARATAELAGEPAAGLRARFLRRVVELAGEPDASPDSPSAVSADATTLFGAEVFARAHARWRAIETAVLELARDDFELFQARFQSRRAHADIAAPLGEPAAAVAARERALVERLRRVHEAPERA